MYNALPTDTLLGLGVRTPGASSAFPLKGSRSIELYRHASRHHDYRSQDLTASILVPPHFTPTWKTAHAGRDDKLWSPRAAYLRKRQPAALPIKPSFGELVLAVHLRRVHHRESQT